MKVIEKRPPLSATCRCCNSKLLIDKEDIVAEVDVICGEVNPGAPDYSAYWICPVCGIRNGDWLYRLVPEEWRLPIELRRGLRRPQAAERQG